MQGLGTIKQSILQKKAQQKEKNPFLLPEEKLSSGKRIF